MAEGEASPGAAAWPRGSSTDARRLPMASSAGDPAARCATTGSSAAQARTAKAPMAATAAASEAHVAMAPNAIGEQIRAPMSITFSTPFAFASAWEPPRSSLSSSKGRRSPALGGVCAHSRTIQSRSMRI